MRVVSGVPPELTVRWAALLHDIGKPSTRSFEPNGRIRFYHHEEVGARIAEDVMISLRVSKECLRAIVLLVETHMQFHSYSAEWSDGAVRRLVQRLGPQFEAALQLARADAAGHNLGGQVPVWNAPKFDELERRAEELALAPTEVTSPLDGHDLMARYGRPAGPWIGRVKDLLRDMVIDGQLAPGDREAAWSLADDIVGRLGA
jgi:poly(A) polymerase